MNNNCIHEENNNYHFILNYKKTRCLLTITIIRACHERTISSGSKTRAHK